MEPEPAFVSIWARAGRSPLARGGPIGDAPAVGKAHEVLGVGLDASFDEIRLAYRRLAKESHPDRHGNSDAAHVRWLEIQLAYEILIDPERRARHDRGEEGWEEDASRWFLERRLAQLVRRRNRLRRLYE